jgi:hypothetical protein
MSRVASGFVPTASIALTWPSGTRSRKVVEFHREASVAESTSARPEPRFLHTGRMRKSSPIPNGPLGNSTKNGTPLRT